MRRPWGRASVEQQIIEDFPFRERRSVDAVDVMGQTRGKGNEVHGGVLSLEYDDV